jgi:phosphatidylglycerol:prolipoprotein diacylglycerol transferase
MLPILADLGFVKIYTNGIFMVLAFFWSAFFLWKNISLTAFKEDEIFDGMFFSLLGGLIFGRLLYVFLHASEFGFSILRIILINGYPGFSTYGALTGIFLFGYMFATSRKIFFGKLVDYAMAPLLLAMGIIKLGAFFAGTEVGSETAMSIAIAYPHLDGMRHLTPLYESILLLGASYLVHMVLLAIRRNKFYSGFNFVVFAGLFSFISLVLDPIKAFRTIVFSMSFDLMVSSVILLTVIGYMLYYFRNSIIDFIKKKKGSKK